MNPAIAAFVGVALLATSYALPIGISLGKGLTMTSQYSDNSLFNSDITIGGRTGEIGLFWDKDGTVTASASVVADLNDKPLPIIAAVSTNLNNPGKQINYQVGASVLDAVSGLVSGDQNGAVKYAVNAWVPVESDGQVTAIGVGVEVEGDQLKPVAVSGGVGVGRGIIGARVGLASDYKPKNVNVIIGG